MHKNGAGMELGQARPRTILSDVAGIQVAWERNRPNRKEGLGKTRAVHYLSGARGHVRRDLARRAKEKSAVLNRVSLPSSNSKVPIPLSRLLSHSYLLPLFSIIVLVISHFSHNCSNGRSSHSLETGTWCHVSCLSPLASDASWSSFELTFTFS